MPATPRKRKPTGPRQKNAKAEAVPEAHRPVSLWLYRSLILGAFLSGLLTSYVAWGRNPQAAAAAAQSKPVVATAVASTAGATKDIAALAKEVNPPDGYRLPVRYGDLGPRLLAAGVINYDAFAALYEKAGSPLTSKQVEVLKQGNNEPIVITPENSSFLLNFFWAVGLANKNSILTEGPMAKYKGGKIESFSSTGGWTLASKPVTELYASLGLIPLTSEQQKRLEEVAAAVYRPCCDNPTLFPDCNHGMAMLGLLELMASQNASADTMFATAKNVNAFWFPQQALEMAVYIKASQGIDFAQADSRSVTGEGYSSSSASAAIHSTLQASGLLPQAPAEGGSCTN